MMKVSVYPNPVYNSLNIKAPELIQDVKIYNLQGMLIYDRKYNDNDVIINLPGHLATGIYQVVIQTETTQQIFKIIKK